MESFRRLMCIVIIVVALSVIFIAFDMNEENAEYVQISSSSVVQAEFTDTARLDTESRPTVWIIGKNAESGTCESIYKNVLQLCEDLHLAAAEGGQLEIDRIAEGDLVIFCDDNISRYADFDEIESFIAGGGRVILAAGLPYENQDSRLWKVLGITDKADREIYNELLFENPLMPVQPGRALYGGESLSTQISVDDDALVYISDKKSKTPVLYTYDYKEGRVCLINGTFLSDIRSAGLLTGAIGALWEDFVYPVMGVKTVFLDNFPMSTYVSDRSCIEMYGYSVESFVEDVVWPGFQRIYLSTETPYTAGILAAAPSAESFPAVNEELFVPAGKSVLQYGGELAYAVGGAKDGTFCFYKEFIERFNATYVNYKIQSAVLTGDNFSEEMMKIPGADIRFIRGTLDSSDMRFSWKDGRTVFPAATVGNSIDDGNLFYAMSVIGAYGMVSHVFDINGMIDGGTWDRCRDQLGIFEADILSEVSWLDGITLSQAGDYVRSYRNMDYAFSRNGSNVEIECSGMKKGQAFFYHTNGRIDKAEGLTYEEAGNGYYLLRVEGNHGTITLKE